MNALPPHLIAAYDQDHAGLRDLVAAANRHSNTSGCQRVGCAGNEAARAIAVMTHKTRGRLLALAVAELADGGWGDELVDVDLTDKATPPLGHEQTARAIEVMAEQLPEPARAAILATLRVHYAHPATGPDSECPSCEGAGEFILDEDDESHMTHCHCGCAWCVGCMTPLCDGPCETVEAIADALHIGASHG